MGSARSIWATLGLPPLTECVLSQSTLLRLQVALQGNCLKRALGCVHFPGLSCSDSGSQVLHKGTDSVGPAFCALPRSKQLRPPDQVLGKCTLPLGGTYYHLPSPSPSASWVCRVSPLGSWSLTATLMADVNHPGSQQDLVSNWELAHRLVEDAVSGAKIAPCLPALTVSRLPLCSSGGRGRSGAGRLSSTI